MFSMGTFVSGKNEFEAQSITAAFNPELPLPVSVVPRASRRNRTILERTKKENHGWENYRLVVNFRGPSAFCLLGHPSSMKYMYIN